MPASLERVVMTCLEKRPEDRWQTMRDLRRELTWAAEAPRGSSSAQASASDQRAWLPWVVAAGAIVASSCVHDSRPDRDPTHFYFDGTRCFSSPSQLSTMVIGSLMFCRHA